MATKGPTFEPVWDDRGGCWRVGEYDDSASEYRYLPGPSASRDPWYAGSCAAIAASQSSRSASLACESDHTGMAWSVRELDDGITKDQMQTIADAATAALSMLTKAEAAALAELNVLGMTLKSKATIAKLRGKHLVDERGKLTPAGVMRARSLKELR